MRDRPLRVELRPSLSLTRPRTRHPIPEPIKPRLPILPMPAKPSTHVRVHVVHPETWLHREQLAPRHPPRPFRRHFPKHQPIVSTLLRIRPYIGRHTVPQVPLSLLGSQRMMAVRGPICQIFNQPQDLLP
jgi:hypothetical protein